MRNGRGRDLPGMNRHDNLFRTTQNSEFRTQHFPDPDSLSRSWDKLFREGPHRALALGVYFTWQGP